MAKSAAHKDGRLRRGDEILSIDDVSVVGSTHRHAISLMSSAAANNKVKLTVRRWNTASRSGSKNWLSSFKYKPTLRRFSHGYTLVRFSLFFPRACIPSLFVYLVILFFVKKNIK